MPKSSKRLILSNERVNSKGFWVVTAGIDLSDFKKNPVCLWMHSRDLEGNKQNSLPIGYWTDIQVNGDTLSAIPVFDDNDTFAMSIYYKVEHGTIRAASIGIEPVQLDTNKANWKTGQTLPTFLKSKVEEASIVDIGSNGDAVAMGGNYPLVKLSKGAADYIAAAVNPTQTAANKRAVQHSPETLSLLKMAVDSGKFTQSEADDLLAYTTTDPAILTIMKNMVKKAPIKPENITGKYHHTLITMAATQSYDELYKYDCQLRSMKANAPDLYKAKFFEKFGYLPVELK